MLRSNLIVAIVLAVFATAQPPPESTPKRRTLEELHAEAAEVVKPRNLMASRSVAEIDARYGARYGRKLELDCLRAVGDEPFCACLRERVPANHEYAFEAYVNALIHTKDELHYSGIPAKSQEGIDQALSAREACVSQRDGGD